MSVSPTETVAQVLAEELRDTPATNFFCARDHAEDLAPKVVEVLGLTQEWFARHQSGGGCGGFATRQAAEEYIVLHPPRAPGVEDPGDPGYIGVEVRYVSRWERPEGQRRIEVSDV